MYNFCMFSDNITLLYPFFYRPMFDVFEDGWQAFLAESEFSRVKSYSEDWRLSYINKNYQVCQIYQRKHFAFLINKKFYF